MTTNMKKAIIIIIAVAILVGGFFAWRGYSTNKQAALSDSLQTVLIERGTLASTVGATGTVRSNQSAMLVWEIPGEVGSAHVAPGDHVSAGDILASLETGSLPAYIILTQADLVSAEKALDNLLNSASQQALAFKAVDNAQQALEDALNPELAQALALADIAETESAVEDTQRRLDILTAPIPQSAIDQAYANMLLAEQALTDLQKQIEPIEQKADHGPYKPWESRGMYKKILQMLQTQLTQLQIKYNDAVWKYESLHEPPDPIEVAVAEAELATAAAQLNEARVEWERVKDGPSPAEIAVLEARLADAQREWERLADGPNPDDITLAETRIAAAQATISQIDIVAPFDGVVTSVEAQPGDQVNPGTLAFRLDDLSHLLVDLGVSEVDINQIEIGQRVTLAFDAILAKEYQGEVVEVAPVGTELLGMVNFKVTVELLDADEYIKPGMTSAVDIVTSQVEDALLVPNQAVRVVDGERVVYVQSPVGTIQAVPITLGATSDIYSEIISGDLQPGDEIILNPPVDIAINTGAQK